MNFLDIPNIPDIIVGKPAKLKIVEYSESRCHHGQPTIYVRGIFGMKQYMLYAKTNIEILRLFFQGRLTVLELFLLGNEYLYYHNKNNDQLTPIKFDEATLCINLLDYDDTMLYSISEDYRCKNPFKILDILEKNYGHS